MRTENDEKLLHGRLMFGCCINTEIRQCAVKKCFMSVLISKVLSLIYDRLFAQETPKTKTRKPTKKQTAVSVIFLKIFFTIKG